MNTDDANNTQEASSLQGVDMPRELEPSAARTETGGAERSGRRYEYGTLTEDFLKALPKKPMSLGESLCGDSKAAQRIRQLGAAYGPVANGALREAMRIKYLEGAEQGGKAGESKDGTQGHIDLSSVTVGAATDIRKPEQP